MDSELINKTISEQKIQLSFWNKVSHYSIVPFLLIFPAFSIIDFVKYYWLKTYDGINPPADVAPFNFFIGLIAIAFIFIQRNRLKLKRYKISATYAQILNALHKTKEELNWSIVHDSESYIQAFRGWDLTLSWGEMITIIPQDGSILINSICDPNKRVSVSSFGMNKTNKRTFLINLYNEVHGTSILKPEEKVNKWSVGNTIFRILAYPFCVGLILFAIFLIFPKGEFALGTSCIIIAAYYFYTDLT